MARERGLAQVTAPMAPVAARLPGWATLVRAPNPGPMTLEGTNTWVLRAPGAAQAVVVDPGPDDEAHLRAVAGHGPFAAVLVTHGHADHIGGLARFQELTGAPLGGADPLPAAGLVITPVATPGHTADSVCFLVAPADAASDQGGGVRVPGEPGERAVLTGDTILGRGTTVVAWPDGDLGDYLASLAELAGLAGWPVLPGHGPPLADCGAVAAAYLTHRRARLDQVRAVLADSVTDPAQVVAAIYPDLDPALRPAAQQSVRAQLAYLTETEAGEAGTAAGAGPGRATGTRARVEGRESLPPSSRLDSL